MDFLKEAMKHPKDTGAVAPSSRKLARMGVSKARLAGAKVVVELGPGTGPFTREILEGLDEDAVYLGIEINEAFVRQLQERFPHATFRHGSAADIGTLLVELGYASCDRVISGIPWSNLAQEEKDAILEAVVAAMAPDGVFVTFAYFPLNHLPPGREVKRALRKHFGDVQKSAVVLGNLPPAFVYVCRK